MAACGESISICRALEIYRWVFEEINGEEITIMTMA